MQAGVIRGGTAVNTIPNRATLLIEARTIPDQSPDVVMAQVLTGLAALSGRAVVPAVSYGTEAGLFAAAGIASVICGPGRIERAHRADEYILDAELSLCRRVLRGD